MNTPPDLREDGRALAQIQPYAEEKHRLLMYYASLFARAIRDKWDSIVYLDLFSGPGRATIDGSNRIVATSPLLVLGLDDKFDRYIFVDADSKNVAALKARIAEEFRHLATLVKKGDINQMASEVISAMPIPGKSRKVLGFCFLDPYRMSNLRFSTIRELSQRFMDFLILIPTGMDAKRAEQYYVQSKNKTVDLFLGDDRWREKWKEEKRVDGDYGDFIVREFTRSMNSLRFLGTDLTDTVPVRNDKNSIVYRLAFYSKDKLGIKLFKQSKKYSKLQIDLFE